MEWSRVDGGVGGAVNAMAIDSLNNFLYVTVGGLGLMRWNGDKWVQISGLLTGDLIPGGWSLEFYNGQLYSGGSSVGYNSAGDSLHFIARWDGENWMPVESGTNSTVLALSVYQDTLYAGGAFTLAGGDSAFYLSKWYSPIDSNCNYLQAEVRGAPDTITLLNGSTVNFENNVSAASSWLWDFGAGSSDTVQNPVYTYDSVGTYIVSVIVTYQNCSDTAFDTIVVVQGVGYEESLKGEDAFIIYPNPSKDQFVIEVDQPGPKEIRIFNLAGELVSTYFMTTHDSELTIQTSGWLTGAYICSLYLEGTMHESKRIIVK